MNLMRQSPRLPKRAIPKIAACLRFCHGNISATAKLLDLEPWRLQYFVGRHDELREWRRDKVGRPPGRLGFDITPYRGGASRMARHGPEVARRITLNLRPEDRAEFIEWIDQIRNVPDWKLKRRHPWAYNTLLL